MLTVAACLALNLILSLLAVKLSFPWFVKTIYLTGIGELFLLISGIAETASTELLSLIILQSCWLFTLYHKNSEIHYLKNKNRYLETTLYKQTALFNEIKTMALCDSLTTIANRRNFDMLLKTEIKRTAIQQKPLSLIIFDIDDFKSYNDTFGHLSGDRLLAQIGCLLKSRFTSEIFPARYGGEEFAIIMTNANQETARQFAEQLRQDIADIKLTNTRPITASFGIAAYEHLNCRSLPDAEKMISVADKSLYRAKCQGKNCVCSANLL